jgi:pyridoxal phosphate enzyme (YggS family)
MQESFADIKKFLDAQQVTLVAVSKSKTEAEIMNVYDQGQRIFGENKVAELIDKYEKLPKDIEWHLVGHLQTNKVKSVVPVATLIHSVDSWKLLEEIEKQSAMVQRITDVLIQVHVAEEETKFGLSINEARKVIADDRLMDFTNIRIRGLMCIASLTEKTEQIRKEFQSVKVLFDEVRLKLLTYPTISDISPSFALDVKFFDIISMGMSNDYKIAIEAGSTMVRIGSAIFEERMNYEL